MKKIVILIFLAGISCTKNYYKDMARDMEEIVKEEEKIIEKIEPIYNRLADLKIGRITEKSEKEYLDELEAIDIEKIKKVNEDFKKKYMDIKLNVKNLYEQNCKEALKEYPGYVDGFINLFEKHKAGAFAREKQFSFPIISLRSNLKYQESFLRACELSIKK